MATYVLLTRRPLLWACLHGDVGSHPWERFAFVTPS
jgi:hypothetical protein